MASRVTVSVHVRDATATGLRQVRNSINRLNRGLLMGLAGAMSDGIGQGLANALRQAASNPYVSAAIVSLVAALATQLGTALAAALTLAFGGAFIALGVMAVQGSKRVQDAFGESVKSLKKEFSKASEPLIPVLEHAAKKMEEVGKRFAPAFAQAMQDAAPFLTRFIDELGRGIEKFAATGFKPMMEAFNSLLEAIDWEGFFADLGAAFANLGATVKRNVGDVAGVFDALLGIIPKLINMIATLTAAWSRIKPWFELITGIVATALTPAFQILATVLRMVFQLQSAMVGPLSLLHRMMKAFYEEAMVPIGNFISGVLGPIWNGLVSGFKEGWAVLERDLVPVLRELWDQLKEITRETLALVPGFEGLRDKSQSAGQVLKEWIIDKLTALGEWIREHREELVMIGGWIAKGIAGAIAAIAFLLVLFVQLAGWVDRAWNLFLIVSGIDAVIRLIGWAQQAWGWITRNWQLILRVYGIDFIINADQWLSRLWGWITRNWAVAVAVTIPGVGTAITALQSLWGWVNRNWSRSVNFNFTVSGAFSSVKSMLGFAHGGVTGSHFGRAATGGARSNMTLVGEQGPELVNLAPGSHVKSNSDSRRFMAQQDGGSGTTTLVIKSGGSRMDDLLLEVLRDAIHRSGGDVVRVLGG